MPKGRGTVVAFKRPFKAVPLRAVKNVPRNPWAKPQAGWGQAWRETRLYLLAIALVTAAGIGAIAFGGSVRLPTFLPSADQAPQAFAAPIASDRESASFVMCSGSTRIDCVIDGDTFWYQGEKIRIADINAPEVSQPACAREANLGAAATDRLHTLLNAGPFTLESIDRDRDSYGRLLRNVTRGGESLGAVLVDEGLAEEWRGYRGSWC